MRSLRAWVLTAISPLLMMVPTLAHSQTLTAMWDPNPPSDAVTSYEICIGTTSLSCNFQSATVPASETSYTFAPSPGVLYYVAVRSINASGPGPFSAEVTVSIPGLTQPANQSSQVNVAISPLSLSASDPDGGTIQFTHSGLPFGLTLNQSTGIITGTPTSPGTSNVTIFVSDDSVTTSRSFVWTVTTGSGDDTAAPTLAITSHTVGQTVSSSSITLAGTATDSGVGGNGITSVTVNGTAAMGGATTGSNTANWNRAVTLAAGANTFTIVATDGAGNARTTAITITHAISAVTSVALTPSLASPRATGTAITFAAGGSGGVGPLQYKFFVQQGNGSAQVVRDWSTTATYTWTPTTAASYTVLVWARSAGVTTDAAQAFAQTNYIITGALAATAITPNLPSPQNMGTTVTFTAASTGGTTPHSYRWWVFSGGMWTLARDWSTSPSFSWTPSAGGNYQIGIWVRDATTTADTSAVNLAIPYVVNSAPPAAPPVATGISADLASPRTVGTSVTFTAGATGGTAPYSYKWWLYSGGTWTLARDWSTSPTFSWTPTAAGNYQIGIWIRNANTTANTNAVNFAIPYSVTGGTSALPTAPSTPTTPITVTTILVDKASPRTVGTTVTFTPVATGGTAPYSYKWWLFSGGKWILARDWSTSPTFSWTPWATGTYQIGIWVRGANTTADTNAVNFATPYVVTGNGNSSPLAATGISANPGSPQNIGTTVTFTAGATGGTGPYSYKWWVFSGGTWTLARNWSTSPTFSWTPAAAGSYQIGIWVRGANTTADTNAVNFAIPYTVTGGSSTGSPLTILNITTNVPSPASVGQTVTATASATGGTAPYQFKWWMFNGATWVLVRDWGPNTLTFTPAPANVNPNFRLGVWARSEGSLDPSGSVNFSISFPIVP
jgi:Putative Ig domain/Glucodextranase, domain B